VSVAEKGYADMKFIAGGIGGHAYAAGPGTPLPRLGEFMHSVERAKLFRPEMTPSTEEMYRRIAARSSGLRAAALRNIAALRPLWGRLLPPEQRTMLHTTIAFTMAGGSGAPNVIPKQAYIIGNLRVAPGETVAQCVAALEKIASRHKVEMELMRNNEPSPVTDWKGPAFRRIERAVAEIYPEAVTLPYLLSGGTDTKHFTKICSECLRFTPLRATAGQQAAVHGTDENIDIVSLPFGVDFFKAIIRG
jgi:carboxypeptidase PM20D1